MVSARLISIAPCCSSRLLQQAGSLWSLPAKVAWPLPCQLLNGQAKDHQPSHYGLISTPADGRLTHTKYQRALPPIPKMEHVTVWALHSWMSRRLKQKACRSTLARAKSNCSI